MGRKIPDIKEIRIILAENEMAGGRPAGLSVAKRIADWYGDQYHVYDEPLADWEKELLRPELATPWVIKLGGVELARFASQEDAGEFILAKVGNSPANHEYAIVYQH